MADTGQLRSTTRSAVVRPLARAIERPCSRPGCPAPAQATLTFRYATREAWIERLAPEPCPQDYDLCLAHAGRTRPPHGWRLRDRRPPEEQAVERPGEPPEDLGGAQTVAVLAAALRRVPEPPAAAPDPEPPSTAAADESAASALDSAVLAVPAAAVPAPPSPLAPADGPTSGPPAPLDRVSPSSASSPAPDPAALAGRVEPAAAPVRDESAHEREDVALGDNPPVLAPDPVLSSDTGAAAGPGPEPGPRPALAARTRDPQGPRRNPHSAASAADQVAFDW